MKSTLLIAVSLCILLYCTSYKISSTFHHSNIYLENNIERLSSLKESEHWPSISYLILISEKLKSYRDKHTHYPITKEIILSQEDNILILLADVIKENKQKEVFRLISYASNGAHFKLMLKGHTLCKEIRIKHPTLVRKFDKDCNSIGLWTSPNAVYLY